MKESRVEKRVVHDFLDVLARFRERDRLDVDGAFERLACRPVTRTSRTVTYRLRVRMSSGQVDYPYTVASSKTVKVTVAP